MGVAHHQSLRAPPTLRLHQRLRGLCGELTGEATGEPPLACTFGGAQLARLDWQHHASGESRGWREAQPGAVCTGRAGGRRVHACGDSTAHRRLRVRHQELAHLVECCKKAREARELALAAHTAHTEQALRTKSEQLYKRLSALAALRNVFYFFLYKLDVDLQSGMQITNPLVCVFYSIFFI